MKRKKQKTHAHRSTNENVLPSSFEIGDVTFSWNKKTSNFYASVAAQEAQEIDFTLAGLNVCLAEEKSKKIDLKNFITFVPSYEEQRIYLEGVGNISPKGAALMWVSRNKFLDTEIKKTPPSKRAEALKPAKRQKKLAPSERAEIPETPKPECWSERLQVKVALEQSRQTKELGAILPATPEKPGPKTFLEAFSPIITVPPSPNSPEEEKYTSPFERSLSPFPSTSLFPPYSPEDREAPIVCEEEGLEEMGITKENENSSPLREKECWVDSIFNSLNGSEGQYL